MYTVGAGLCGPSLEGEADRMCVPLPRIMLPVLALMAVLIGPSVGLRGSTTVAAQRPAQEAAQVGVRFSPAVQYTGRPPTGYTVTFRYKAPTATSVRIIGEWSFINPTQSTGTSTPLLPPARWLPGAVPSSEGAPYWPVSSMTEDRQTGVWSLTLPLPSGTFTYGFLVNCSEETQASCTEIADPRNLPWNTHAGTTAGSIEPDSQVYVPSDPAYNTVNYWWQAPNPRHGTLTEATYASPLSLSPRGTHPLAVYTPPGYNPHRATPYPTLYLSHGSGGNEVDWSTQGAAAAILDNLIDTGQVQPMVVVMTNFNGFAEDCSGEDAWAAAYDQDLLHAVIPYVRAHYHVSNAASERAFAGLSCGGYLATSLLATHTSAFGFYGVMSPGPDPVTYLLPLITKQHTPQQQTAARQEVAALAQVGILVGGGWQDPLHGIATTEAAVLQHLGIDVFTDFLSGGHEWYVWRILLYDFLTHVAFLPVHG